MDRVAVQDPVLKVQVTVVAVQTLDSRDIKVITVIKIIKAIRVATISSQIRGISNSNLDIRVTRNS